MREVSHRWRLRFAVQMFLTDSVCGSRYRCSSPIAFAVRGTDAQRFSPMAVILCARFLTGGRDPHRWASVLTDAVRGTDAQRFSPMAVILTDARGFSPMAVILTVGRAFSPMRFAGPMRNVSHRWPGCATFLTEGRDLTDDVCGSRAPS